MSTLTVDSTASTQADRTAVTRNMTIGGLLVGLLVGLGVSWTRTALPFNTQLVDFLFPVLAIAALVGWSRDPAKFSWSAFRRVAPWLWLIAIADIVAIAAAGVHTYAILQMIRDLFAFGILFWVLALVDGRRSAERGVVGGMIVGALACVGMIVSSGQARPNGLFDTPNYAAHYLVCVTLLVAMSRMRRRSKVPLVVVLLVGIVSTYSFGGLLFLFSSTGYWIWCRVGSRSPGVRHSVRGLVLVAIAIIAVSGVINGLATSATVQDSPFGSDRFDRSSSSRFEIWGNGLSLASTHLQGVGPGAVAAEGLAVGNLELHNDYLSYLAERGVGGFIGLIGLGVALWRLSSPGGRARVMFCGFALASMFRETLNYRHLWVVFALMLLWDWQDRSRRGVDDHSATAAPQTLVPTHLGPRRPSTG